MNRVRFIGAWALAGVLAMGAVPPAFQNYDNSCFFHAMLQNVLNLGPIIQEILQDKPETKGANTPFLNALRALANGMFASPKALQDTKAIREAVRVLSPLAPPELLNDVREKRWRGEDPDDKRVLSKKGQCDSGEALSAMLLDERFGTLMRTKYGGPMFKSECALNVKRDKDPMLISGPLVCAKKMKPEMHGDVFVGMVPESLDMPLLLPLKPGDSQFTTPIENFFMFDLVKKKGESKKFETTDFSMPQKDKITVYDSGAWVQLPEFLIFLLKRTYFDSVMGVQVKLSPQMKKVPLELVMDPWLDRGNQIAWPADFDRTYNLIGVVEQYGNPDAGHYRAYIKDQYDPQRTWYTCDDLGAQVKELLFDAKNQDVIDKTFGDGYVFFYRKSSAEQQSILQQRLEQLSASLRTLSSKVSKA
jgi:hypothetical protein